MEETVEKRSKGIKVKYIVLGIVLVLVIIFLVHTIRNFMIITNTENKGKEYANILNHMYRVTYHNKDNGTLSITWYKKGDKKLMIQQSQNSGNTNKIMIFYNGEKVDVYKEENGQKTATLDVKGIATYNYEMSYGIGEFDNLWEKIMYSVRTSVKSKEYDKVKCYQYTMVDEDNVKHEVYVEKDTGLLKAVVSDTEKEIFDYQFDNFNDSVFTLPDINEYKINN